MRKERTATWMLIMGVFWAAIAVLNGAMMYRSEVRTVHLLTFGLAALVSGMFFGQAIQKKRADKTQP